MVIHFIYKKEASYIHYDAFALPTVVFYPFLPKNASTKKLIFGKELRKNFFQRICRLMQFGNFLLIQIDWNLGFIAIAANDTRQT